VLTRKVIMYEVANDIVGSSEHCCNLMTKFIDDTRIPINYSRKFREYYVPLGCSYAIQCITFCSWCGARLPKDLRDEYFDIIEKEYEAKNLPEEFKYDIWWKKRGL
jgi:hypothetical protein